MNMPIIETPGSTAYTLVTVEVLIPNTAHARLKLQQLLAELRDSQPQTVIEVAPVRLLERDMTDDQAVDHFRYLQGLQATNDVLDVLAQYEDTNGLSVNQQIKLLDQFVFEQGLLKQFVARFRTAGNFIKLPLCEQLESLAEFVERRGLVNVFRTFLSERLDE